MNGATAPQFVVLACDESGAKGYADRDEQTAGEVGVFAGILVPGELLASAQAQFDATAAKYQTRPGKVHITDLTPVDLAGVIAPPRVFAQPSQAVRCRPGTEPDNCRLVPAFGRRAQSPS